MPTAWFQVVDMSVNMPSCTCYGTHCGPCAFVASTVSKPFYVAKSNKRLHRLCRAAFSTQATTTVAPCILTERTGTLALQGIDTVILDCDGVLWVGSDVVRNANAVWTTSWLLLLLSITLHVFGNICVCRSIACSPLTSLSYWCVKPWSALRLTGGECNERQRQETAVCHKQLQ